MSRSLKLTWQPGMGVRSGRWRKKYRGKVCYFAGGRGKSDCEAYDAAVQQWELEKLKADAAAPREYQHDHEVEIDVWEQVLTWSMRHGDTAMAQIAYEKREKIRAQLAAPVLKPLSADDRFGTVFQPVTIELPDDLLEQAARSLAAGEVSSIAYSESTPETRRRHLQELDGRNPPIASTTSVNCGGAISRRDLRRNPFHCVCLIGSFANVAVSATGCGLIAVCRFWNVWVTAIDRIRPSNSNWRDNSHRSKKSLRRLLS